MPDEIVGLTVLQKTATDGIYHLWLRCKRDDGSTFETYLHMAEEATQNVPDRVDGYQVWRFKRAGSSLNCHPSLLCRGSENFKEFHSNYAWTVEHVEMTAAMPSEPNQATIWWKLNEQDINGKDELTPDQRRVVVTELREKGLLV